MANRNQSGIITRSVLGVNILGNSLGNQTNNQPSSLRIKDSIREGFSFSGGSTVQEMNGGDGEGMLEQVGGSGQKIRDGEKSEAMTREAEYIASFPVVGGAQEDKSEYIRKHLLELKTTTKTRPVYIVVSLSGIKVCCRSGETVLMAHALKRISYATCHPDQCQFSFLAREPKSQSNVQYCHAFSTRTAQEAEELNAVVADAFRRAYDGQKLSAEAAAAAAETSNSNWSGTAVQQQQLQLQQQRSFNDLIEGQIEAKREQLKVEAKQKEQVLTQRLSQISTPHVDSLAAERRERRQRELGELDLRLPTSSSSSASLTPRSVLTPGAGSSRGVSTPSSVGASGISSSSPSPLSRGPEGPAPSSTRLGGAGSRASPTNSGGGRLNRLRGNAASPLRHSPSPSVTSVDDSYRPVTTAGVSSLSTTHSLHNISNGSTGFVSTRAGVAATSDAGRLGDQSNEEILAVIRASLYQCRTNGSPVTIFKEAVDEYFRARASHFPPAMGTSDRLGGTLSSLPIGGIDPPSARQSPNRSQIGRKIIDAVTNRSSNWQPNHAPDESSANGIVRIASLRTVQKPTSLCAQPLRADLFTADVGCRSSWSPAGAASRDSPGESRAGGEFRGRDIRVGEMRGVDEDVNGGGGPGSGGNSPSLSQATGVGGSRVIGGDDDRHLAEVHWYQPGLQRELALDWLSRQEPGHFLVRDSTTHPGCYALSIKVPKQDNSNGITHYLVMKTAKGTFKIKGLAKEWSSLTALVTHHTVMKEILPCVLIMPSQKPALSALPSAAAASAASHTPTSAFSRDELLNY